MFCLHYCKGKTEKNVVNSSDHVKSNIVGKIMFLDLSSAKPPKEGVKIPKPQWRMIVDEANNLKISYLYAKKMRWWNQLAS
jgi:hypothetical protein